MAKQILRYLGTFLHEINEQNQYLGLDPYQPSSSLIEAVNLAIILNQPLLLMGEPGCGKTRLAEAVAAELHQNTDYTKRYFRWDIKSTSKAKEGIYQYDALRRLYDANAGQADAREITNYISDGPLLEAFKAPQHNGLPNILLIDEIDKADIDFPNDLLLELDKASSFQEKQFFIPELNDYEKGSSKVLIFITSNRERELPAAFLRRCLYHKIEFPKGPTLVNILKAKFGKKTNQEEAFIRNAVSLFWDVRDKVKGFSESEKRPSTSELIEWFHIIEECQKLKNKPEYSPQEKELLNQLEVIENYDGNVDGIRIPFQQVLLKTWESNLLFEKSNRS